MCEKGTLGGHLVVQQRRSYLRIDPIAEWPIRAAGEYYTFLFWPGTGVDEEQVDDESSDDDDDEAGDAGGELVRLVISH